MRLTYFWQYSIFSRELDKFLRPRRGFYWRGGLNREFTVYGERSAFLPRWLAVSLASILQCNYTFFSVPGPSAETFLTISVSNSQDVLRNTFEFQCIACAHIEKVKSSKQPTKHAYILYKEYSNFKYVYTPKYAQVSPKSSTELSQLFEQWRTINYFLMCTADVT